jgi:hypothetical protein
VNRSDPSGLQDISLDVNLAAFAMTSTINGIASPSLGSVLGSRPGKLRFTKKDWKQSSAQRLYFGWFDVEIAADVSDPKRFTYQQFAETYSDFKGGKSVAALDMRFLMPPRSRTSREAPARSR